MSKFCYHPDGGLPDANEIFVFGSNESGSHGAGAAKVAHGRFGAKHGTGFGFMGQSFAIPTKDWKIMTLPVSAIAFYVERFASFIQTSTGIEFYVTRIGCGLAGYSDADIAPLFKNCNASNCVFPEQWKDLLES